MNVLFDTQAFLWWCMGHPKMSHLALDALDGADQAFFSPVNLWEIGLKESGKGFEFPIPTNWQDVMIAHAERHRVIWLPISPKHCRMIQDLTFHHKDPFDRMIIAQAIEENLAVMTSDPLFAKYGVEVVW